VIGVGVGVGVGKSSVLVANRGEIAVRIMRTCRRLGLRCIAVYSDADADALHVAMADEAYRIGPPPPGESYLDGPAIVAAARASGAAAVHPGYGFLAENPDFAELCQAAGLAWVGPTPAAMRALGDKARARSLARQLGVPILPGYEGDRQDAAFLRRQADDVGYPLLIKASAGGGGRGMRLVGGPAEFEGGLEAATREAQSSFGDGRVVLERYLPHARHVEVQILGDSQGTLLHLGERECSIQRRNQKLLEESPSPAVNGALRERLGAAAVRLGRAVGYTSAGTVEFLLDRAGELFFFLEVNARLQVEHPVTEAVTGLDLVELQLRVAGGGAVGVEQNQVLSRGHAIEARLIAEDPGAGFLPSVGRIDVFEPPPEGRNDVGVRVGSQVTPYYDSLLGKLIVHAAHRPAAVIALADGLRRYAVGGVRTNLDLLLAVAEHPAFVAGDVDTGFLAERRVVESLADVPPEVVAAAAALDVLAPPATDTDTAVDPWRRPAPWRTGRQQQPSTWLAGGVARRVVVSEALGSPPVVVDVDLDVASDGTTWRVAYLGLGATGQRCVRVGDDMARVLDRPGSLEDERVVQWQGRTWRLRRQALPSVEELALIAGGAHGASASRLTAPMPGRVLKLMAAVGDQVASGQPLILLEAMKMEHVLQAPRAGGVAAVHVRPGDQVASGAPLLDLGDEEQEQESNRRGG